MSHPVERQVFPLSVGLDYAWQLAASEAIQSGSELIEPEHLLIGILSVEKLCTPEMQRRYGFSPEVASALKEECSGVDSLLQRSGTSASGLRRSLRARLKRGAGAPNRTQIRRSAETRQVFSIASRSAEEFRAAASGLAHAWAAVLERRIPVLNELGLDVAGLEKAARSAVAAAVAYLPSPLAHPGTGAADEHGPHVESGAEAAENIAESLDASMPMRLPARASESERRLNLLLDVHWQFGLDLRLDALLQTVLEHLVAGLPGGCRGAFLVKSPTGSLLLKAHIPSGGPAVSMGLAGRAMRERQAFIWRASEDVTASLAQSNTACAMYAPLLWKNEALGVLCVDHPQAMDAFSPDDLRSLLVIAHNAATMVATRQLEDDLRRSTSILERLLTNFSPKIRTRLMEKARHGRLRLGGERSEVTILYSDIRGFTRLSADLDADEVVEMLNEYLSALVGAIFRYDGTVDKFVGDAILAVFGSPEEDPRQQENAVRAALEMQSAAAEVTRRRAARNEVVCEIGIGVHTGEVLHGFIGSVERMEFTVIGDTVNRAARFCAGAGPGQVILSPEVHQQVWKVVEVQPHSVQTKHEGVLPAYLLNGLRS